MEDTGRRESNDPPFFLSLLLLRFTEYHLVTASHPLSLSPSQDWDTDIGRTARRLSVSLHLSLF